jgi:uncharacterized protein (DUF58 family)
MKHRPALLEGEKLGLRYALALPQATLVGLRGEQLGKRAGSSVDFQDYRDYQPGDDLRHIDWNAFARTDQLIVKLFREEAQPHLDLILDTSGSMALKGTPKADALLKLAAIFSTAAMNARCSQAVWMTGEGFNRVGNDTEPPSAWAGIEVAGAHTFEESFAILPPALRRQGIRVLISDLLWPGDPLPTLRKLSEDAAALYVVQVLSEDDLEPPEPGNLELVDSETGETLNLYIDATIREQYHQTFIRFQQSWDNAARKTGAKLVTLTAENLENSLRRLEEIDALEPV